MQKIVYVYMDGVLVNFQSGIDKLSPENQKEYKGKEEEVHGIFFLMEPMKGQRVIMSAGGPGSEVFSGYYDNTDIAKKLPFYGVSPLKPGRSSNLKLWYQYVVRFHAGGDNIHQNQLFFRTKRHDSLQGSDLAGLIIKYLS